MKNRIFSMFLVALTMADDTVNRKCRELLTCTRKKCVKIDELRGIFTNSTIGPQLYDALDKAIDYGCILTAGCMNECNRCPLCLAAKEQLVDVLTGTKRDAKGDCSVLVNCATDCVHQDIGNLTAIGHCLRQTCAVNCFDGDCPRCTAFITRIFNQICVSGELRQRIQAFQGQCYQLFRAIIEAKFGSDIRLPGTKLPAE